MAALALISMLLSCSKEKSSGVLLLMSDSAIIDHNAQDVNLGYKVLLDNGSSISVTTDADWVNVGIPGGPKLLFRFRKMIPELSLVWRKSL